MSTSSDATQATHVRWSAMAADSPLELIKRRRLIGAQVMVSHVTLQPGFSVPMHEHANEQVTCVLSGRFRFTVGFPDALQIIEMAAGEALLLPGGVPHGGEAVEETVILDIFSPPSEKTGVDVNPHP